MGAAGWFQNCGHRSRAGRLRTGRVWACCLVLRSGCIQGRTASSTRISGQAVTTGGRVLPARLLPRDALLQNQRTLSFAARKIPAQVVRGRQSATAPSKQTSIVSNSGLKAVADRKRSGLRIRNQKLTRPLAMSRPVRKQADVCPVVCVLTVSSASCIATKPASRVSMKHVRETTLY